MPTNNIKHQMLKYAKEFAKRKFFGYILTVDTKDGQDFVDISAKQEEREELNKILIEHPEYDGTEFRNMIKKAKEVLKEKEREYNER